MMLGAERCPLSAPISKKRTSGNIRVGPNSVKISHDFRDILCIPMTHGVKI